MVWLQVVLEFAETCMDAAHASRGFAPGYGVTVVTGLWERQGAPWLKGGTRIQGVERGCMTTASISGMRVFARRCCLHCKWRAPTVIKTEPEANW